MLKILCVGDIHLGRRPSRIPSELAPPGGERGLTPAAAWERTVEAACRAGVDAVLLAGDVVEGEDDFYEGYRHLDRGVRQLAKAGIEVLGVAGNHDFRVLPRLASEVESFRLLGAGGEWERVTLQPAGEPVTVHGWSFPERQVRRSPLGGRQFERGDGPNLGLLHCDRGQPDSPYAPVAPAELERAGLDGWLLGHVHAPDDLAAGHPSGYLGCISGMDPGEPGDHGPWLLSIEGGRIRSLEQWVLAPLRWEPLELDLSGLAEAEDARRQLLERLRERDAEIAAKTAPPEAVGLRVRLVGRSALGPEVQRLLQQDEQAVIFDGAAGSRYFVERCLSDTRPVVSLEDLARRSDPPGLLARRLLLLEHPQQEAARRLIADGRRRLEAQRHDSRWQPLPPEPLDDAAVADWLRRAGARLLQEMLAQQGEATE
ncbi:MAG TPA: DNA repair exonuclease [Gammaproteobacteria bacterium]|nr:DNA repair exonuclease [Gammaproteobacteria bacterium]